MGEEIWRRRRETKLDDLMSVGSLSQNECLFVRDG